MRGRLRKLISDAKRWHARADEMRSVAAEAPDPKVKATASGAADAYEKLARLEGTRAALPRSRHVTPENSD
jgi:hypothetical protein